VSDYEEAEEADDGSDEVRDLLEEVREYLDNASDRAGQKLLGKVEHVLDNWDDEEDEEGAEEEEDESILDDLENDGE
jgi:ElaB/YqjD/DUF883 family membrane-anchored ribosome-binding protein